MPNRTPPVPRDFPILSGLLVLYGIAVSMTLPGKYPWHDEITTLRDCHQPFSHILKTYYTHKGYILSAKSCLALLGESFTVLRLPSLLMGGASLLAVYWLGTIFFRRSVGLATAAYLLLHPSFLFHSTDARGYQGAFLFAVLGMGWLWRGLSEVRIRDCLFAASALFLGLMMQPTAALTYPGLGLMALGLVVKTYRDTDERAHDKQRRLTWLLGLTVLFGLILLGPRLWNYARWETLLIPSRFAVSASEGAGGVPGPGPLRTLDGWKNHLAPVVSAELHTGPVLALGLLLMLVSLLLPEPGKRHRIAGLLFAFVSPLIFFMIYNPPFLVQRYLYAALPFGVLLIVYGSFEIARRIGERITPPRRRWVRRGIEAWLLLCLGWNCWGPFRAEIAFSEYGSTWMIPLSDLWQQDFMEGKNLVLLDEKPLWRDQMEMLGIPKERLVYYRASGNLEEAPLPGDLSPRDWVIIRAYSQFPRLQSHLRKEGRPDLRIEQGILFPPPTGETGAEGAAGGDTYRAIRFLHESHRLDFRFDRSASRILKTGGFEEEADEYLARAMVEMERIQRWDYPRTFGAYTVPLAEYALENDRPLESAKILARAFGKPQSRSFDYVFFIDKIPGETQNRIVRSWWFGAGRFAGGFIEALERAENLGDDYRAYWSFKGAQLLDRNGFLKRAWSLYEYSIAHGDTLGRAAQRLFRFHLKEGNFLEAAEVYLRGIGKPGTPWKHYADLFEAIPEEEWKRVTELEAFDVGRYAAGLVSALKADGELSVKKKSFWAKRIGNILEDLGFHAEGENLKNAFPGKE